MRFASVRERPRFRQDLIAEAIDEQGARFIDVMTPEGNSVFRFYEAEYSLACGMDGERDIAGLVKWAQDELGLTSSHQEVRHVIATLNDLGFIETGEAAQPAPELAPGVQVALPDRPAPSTGGELGAAGAAAARGAALPAAPDLALGAAGAPRSARPTPAPTHEVGPGARPVRPTPAPPAPSEVSIDLSDHMAVRPDDVKEAVRASRVMSAVEAPTEVEDRPTAPAGAAEPAFERPPAVARPTARAAEPVFERPPEAARPTDMARPPEVLRTPEVRRPDSRPEIRVGKSPPSRQSVVAKPPVELPPPPAVERSDRTEKSPPPPEARPGVSPALIVVAIIVFFGAGAFLVWKYVLEKPTAGVDTTTAAPPPPVKPPPPPPPPPTAKVVLETPPTDEVKLPRAGQIETIVADKTPLKETDVVVRLTGDRPVEGELTAIRRDKKRLEDQVEVVTKRRDNAHASGNKAGEAAAQADLADRQKALAAKETQLANKTHELETFLIRAQVSGVFTQQGVVKNGAKLAADAVVGTIQRDPIPTATFRVGNTRSFASNGGVEVAIGKGELRLTCTVVDVGGDSVKVTCPADPELTDGTDVTLKTPTATAPEAPEAPPAGSAAPSGAAPGSAKPGDPAASGTPPTETPPMPSTGSAAGGSAAGGSASGSAAAPPLPH